MYLPILSLLLLLPPLVTLVLGRSMDLVSLLISLLLLLSLVVSVMGMFLHKRGKRNLFVPMPFLLAHTVIFLCSTYSSSTLASFSPLLISYNTILLMLFGYVLSIYCSLSWKSLLLIGGSSLGALLVGLFLFPFSPLFLLNASLPVLVLLFENHKKKEDGSASRTSLQSMLAHEIRTPLTIMQTTTNLLLEEIPGPLNARQKQFVQSNYEYTQRLITFSENMLTLLKFDREFELTKREKINIRLITQDIVTFFGPLLSIKGQTIRYSFPALLNNPIGDESLIRQVFINLIHNAVKHTREGGYIIISVTQDDDQMVVSITDNGEGVAGDGRETLFREFYQEKGASEEFQDGFGLGLSIARQIIQKHGGDVYITSVKDKGTMVSCTLPAKAIR